VERKEKRRIKEFRERERERAVWTVQGGRREEGGKSCCQTQLHAVLIFK